MAKHILYFLIFPGFLFTVLIGLVSTWVDRKVTARVQWRVGPPFLQPFYDFVKLLGKETLVPVTANRIVFLAAPFAGLIAVTLVSTILWLSVAFGISVLGDVIVVVYLLVIPSLALMIGGMASGNPLASIGANREMKLILAYELPFIICLATVIVKSGMSIQLEEIAGAKAIGSVSGAVACVLTLLCLQAKLGFVPFDVAEAETEIMEGTYIEYSGPLLAVYKLTQAMMLFTLPVFLISVFLGGLNLTGLGILWAILKYVAILVLIIVIKNTNPRVRIDQAMKFFWRYLTPIAIAAFILSAIGNVAEIPWL
jgi:NADH-quinone oxidoreductase subunit H